MYFRFQDPVFASLIALLIAAIWLRKFWGRHASLQFSSNWAINRIIKRKFSRFRKILVLLRVLALILIILGLMRPQTGRKWTEQVSSGIDIMLAIDLSGSMHAHDFEMNNKLISRLEIVKSVVTDFTESRVNDRIGLLVFAEEPYLVSPLTRNHDWLNTNFNRLNIGVIGPNSTAIGSAIGMGINRLRKDDGESKILILLTDGENNAGKLPPIAAADAAKSFGIKIYTIGVGKTGSILMPRQRNGIIVKNSNGNPIMDWIESDIDEYTLREIAHITEGKYFRAISSEGLKTIYEEIDNLEKREITFVRYDEANDLMVYPLLTAFVLLLLEVILSRTIFHKIP
jgi:Ca-activated chloride channel homolog